MTAVVKGVQSLSVRVALIISVALFSLMLIVSLIIDNQLTNAIERQENEQVELQARSLLTSLETLMLTGNGPLVRDWFEKLNGANGILDTKIFNLQLKEAFRDSSTIDKVNSYLGYKRFSHVAAPDSNGHLDIPVDLLSSAISEKKTSTTIQGSTFSIAMPIMQDDACITCHGYDDHDIRGIFLITVDREKTEHRVIVMRTKLWFATIIVTLVLGLGLFYLLRKGVLAPLTDLRDAIIRVASGERTIKLPVAREDELGVVARLFNSMQEHIEESEARIRAVMDNVLDAVLILNVEGRVEAANPVIYRLFGYMPSEVVGRHVSIFLVPENHHDEGVRYLSEEFFSRDRIMCGPIREDVGLRKDHSVLHIDVSMNEMLVGDILHYVVTFRDATLRVEQMRALKHLALHDPLTGLPNRTLLADRLQQVISVSEREESHFSLMFMDLDRFKVVNDSLGHYIGDELLRVVADRVQSVVRRSDTVARLGGDEFAILLPGMNSDMAKRYAERIIHILDELLVIEGNAIDVGASIGIAVFPEHAKDQVTIMQHADVAMYVAKRNGHGVFVYDPSEDLYNKH